MRTSLSDAGVATPATLTAACQAAAGRLSSTRVGWALLGLLWLCALAYGLRERFLYETTAGAVGTTPQYFPVASRLPRAPDRSTLFMFIHAECPCTRASLHELAALVKRDGAPLRPVLVVAPAIDPAQPWEQTPAAALAARIPGLLLFADATEAEASRFGAETSGFVALYDAQGKLQFAGGITASRGHEGDNLGRRTIRELTAHPVAHHAQHAVYGCPLAAPTEAER